MTVLGATDRMDSYAAFLAKPCRDAVESIQVTRVLAKLLALAWTLR